MEIPFSGRQEKASNLPRMLDVFTLTQSELDQIRQDVANNNGAIQIWIHTHYNEFDLYSDLNTDHRETSENAARYMVARERMIASANRASMPVIAFLEPSPRGKKESAVERYRKIYGQQWTANKPIYYANTMKGDPTPSYNTDPYQTLTEGEEFSRWTQFSEFCRNNLGVKTVILRGAYFDFAEIYPEDWTIELLYAEKLGVTDRKLPIPDKCVGYAFMYLSHLKIDTRLSSIVYPGNPREMFAKQQELLSMQEV